MKKCNTFLASLVILQLLDLEYLGSPWTEAGKRTTRKTASTHLFDTILASFLSRAVDICRERAQKHSQPLCSHSLVSTTTESQHTPPSICWVTKKRRTSSVVTPAVAASQATNIRSALCWFLLKLCAYTLKDTTFKLTKNSKILYYPWIRNTAPLE